MYTPEQIVRKLRGQLDIRARSGERVSDATGGPVNLEAKAGRLGLLSRP